MTEDDNGDLRPTDLGPGALRVYLGLHERRCIVWCRGPRGLYRRYRCPDCYQKAHVIDVRDVVGLADYRQDYDEPTRLGLFLGYLARAFRDALEMLRWHPYAPLVTLRWRVPRYLDPPECAVCAAAEEADDNE